MSDSRIVCVLIVCLVLLGCTRVTEIKLYSPDDGRNPTRMIEDGHKIQQVKRLTANLIRIDVEEAAENGYGGKSRVDLIFEFRGSKWFVYVKSDKAVIRKNAGTFYIASESQTALIKEIFKQDL